MTAAATVEQALAQARAAGVDRLDAQLLLADAMQRPRTWLLANGGAAVGSLEAGRYARALARRTGGEPLAYIVGEKEFHGLALKVDSRVLVPRPDTETLVDWALDLLRAGSWPARPRVIDLGTGSGAIAIAIKHACAAAELCAVDASAEALDVARANAQRLKAPIDFRRGDWWDAVRGDRFDLAVANPPYIAAADPHLAALRHEPALALVSGTDGLDAIGRIIAGAPGHLNPGAWLLLEHGHDQAGAVHALLHAAGFIDVQSRRDLAGIARCTGARFDAER